MQLQEVRCGGQVLRPGKTAELVDGTFVRVGSIVERHWALAPDGSGGGAAVGDGGAAETLLCGPRFKRTRCFQGLLPAKLNEVAMFAAADSVPVRQVRRLRCLVLTNAAFPAHNDVRGLTVLRAENEGRLVCRWLAAIPQPAAATATGDHVMYAGSLRRLREDEADERFRAPDWQLRQDWRGEGTRVRGRHRGRSSAGASVPYTFGDAFCGGGGMACGARAAGLAVRWGFDHDRDACHTFGSNFPEAEVFQTPVNYFVTAFAGAESLQVDVLHLSPPCQPHSVAHTVAGKDDETNEAAGLCVSECLAAVRPRYGTFEQAFGLVYRAHWFRTAIRGFTDVGFSVRWDILHCVQYGVPQTRRRLFMVAAW